MAAAWTGILAALVITLLAPILIASIHPSVTWIDLSNVGQAYGGVPSSRSTWYETGGPSLAHSGQRVARRPTAKRFHEIVDDECQRAATLADSSDAESRHRTAGSGEPGPTHPEGSATGPT
jgi:hypothetical protein